jgi:hypothetical protein
MDKVQETTFTDSNISVGLYGCIWRYITYCGQISLKETERYVDWFFPSSVLVRATKRVDARVVAEWNSNPQSQCLSDFGSAHLGPRSL